MLKNIYITCLYVFLLCLHYLTYFSAHGHSKAQILMLLPCTPLLQRQSPKLHWGRKPLSSMLPEKGSTHRREQLWFRGKDMSTHLLKIIIIQKSWNWCGYNTCRPSAVSKPSSRSLQSSSMGRPSSHNSPFTVLTNAPFALTTESQLERWSSMRLTWENNHGWISYLPHTLSNKERCGDASCSLYCPAIR